MTARRATATRHPSRLGIGEFDTRQRLDGLALLRSLPTGCAALMVFDPQYRGVLDHLGYGNEGVSRERERAALPAQSERAIARFIEQAERVLKPGGHLLLWIDKFMLAKGRQIALFAFAHHMERVELIHWNKLRPGMGKRARARSEYLIVAQKPPISAKLWASDRRIADSWPEGADRSEHPHTKPYQLTERLVRALTKQGDTVVDPCAGSYLTMEVCSLTRRRFMGCDLVTPV